MSDFEVKATELDRERFKGVKIVRVEATVIFEAYALTDIADFNGRSVEDVVAGEIAGAIGYRAVNGSDTEPGDALIAMTSHPDFAADVRNLSVTILPRAAEMDHVAEMAHSTSGSW